MQGQDRNCNDTSILREKKINLFLLIQLEPDFTETQKNSVQESARCDFLYKSVLHDLPCCSE